MPRKSKKAADEDAEQAPVRRSTRARRTVVMNEEPDDFEIEPPKKRARGKRASATAVTYDDEDSNEPQGKDKESDEDEAEEEEEEKPKTPAKGRGGRGRKPAAEHKDTPAPSRAAPKGRGRKRQQPDEVKEEAEDAAGDAPAEEASAASSKKQKKEDKKEEPKEDSPKKAVQTEGDDEADDAEGEAEPADKKDAKKDDPKPVEEKKEATETKKEEVAPKEAKKESTPTPVDDAVAKENGTKTAEVKEPSGKESNAAVESAKDVTVATAVLEGSQGTKETLEKLENPDIVAAQKSTSAAAEAAENCGFKVVGDGPTRILLRSGSSIVVKGLPERISLQQLALKELKEISSEANRRRVGNYVLQNSSVNDELMVVTLVSRGKPFTLLNIQMESKNVSVAALMIGCVMRHFDSKPNAFVVTGHMPHVRPGTPAYELLRDGYFGNRSIETLQMMQDIELDDADDDNRGLIDFLWKAYQHSRPWMRSVYETVLKAESVVSSTGCGMLWHSTKGIDVVEVLNDAKLVKADLAIKI